MKSTVTISLALAFSTVVGLGVQQYNNHEKARVAAIEKANADLDQKRAAAKATLTKSQTAKRSIANNLSAAATAFAAITSEDEKASEASVKRADLAQSASAYDFAYDNVADRLKGLEQNEKDHDDAWGQAIESYQSALETAITTYDSVLGRESTRTLESDLRVWHDDEAMAQTESSRAVDDLLADIGGESVSTLYQQDAENEARARGMEQSVVGDFQALHDTLEGRTADAQKALDAVPGDAAVNT
jgi:hypothetical protein